MALHKFIIYLGTGVIFAAFLVALMFANKQKPNYFKLIFGYILGGVLLSLNAIIFLNENIFENIAQPFFVQNILMILQAQFIGFFYYDVLINVRFKKITLNTITIVWLSQVLFLILKNTSVKYIQISIALELFIFSILYFKELLSSEAKLNLSKSPSFWIAIGVFFYASISFPIYCFQPLISIDLKYTDISNQIFSFSNMSLIVMYLFFIKSYLCLKTPQNL